MRLSILSGVILATGFPILRYSYSSWSFPKSLLMNVQRYSILFFLTFFQLIYFLFPMILGFTKIYWSVDFFSYYLLGICLDSWVWCWGLSSILEDSWPFIFKCYLYAMLFSPSLDSNETNVSLFTGSSVPLNLSFILFISLLLCAVFWLSFSDLLSNSLYLLSGAFWVKHVLWLFYFNSISYF